MNSKIQQRFTSLLLSLYSRPIKHQIIQDHFPNSEVVCIKQSIKCKCYVILSLGSLQRSVPQDPELFLCHGSGRILLTWNKVNLRWWIKALTLRKHTESLFIIFFSSHLIMIMIMHVIKLNHFGSEIKVCWNGAFLNPASLPMYCAMRYLFHADLATPTFGFFYPFTFSQHFCCLSETSYLWVWKSPRCRNYSSSSRVFNKIYVNNKSHGSQRYKRDGYMYVDYTGPP